MYRADNAVRFATGRYGVQAVMQGDGNFVQYLSNGQPSWHTGTFNHPNAYLNVQDDGNLVIYTNTNVPLWNIGADFSTGTDPRVSGDVVGRDLNVTGLGALGHIGFWDGSRVYEAIQGGGNAVRAISIADFKRSSAYWGVASANIPTFDLYGCPYTTCYNYPANWLQASARMWAARRALQIQQLGADYTLSVFATSATPASFGNPARRGLYRCDTFVIDVFKFRNGGFNDPTQAIQRWYDLVMSLDDGPLTPRSVFNKLKAYR